MPDRIYHNMPESAQPEPSGEMEGLVDYIRGSMHDSVHCIMPDRTEAISALRRALASRPAGSEELFGLLTEAREMLISTPEPESGKDRALKNAWLRTYRRLVYARASHFAASRPDAEVEG